MYLATTILPITRISTPLIPIPAVPQLQAEVIVGGEGVEHQSVEAQRQAGLVVYVVVHVVEDGEEQGVELPLPLPGAATHPTPTLIPTTSALQLVYDAPEYPVGGLGLNVPIHPGVVVLIPSLPHLLSLLSLLSHTRLLYLYVTAHHGIVDTNAQSYSNRYKDNYIELMHQWKKQYEYAEPHYY